MCYRVYNYLAAPRGPWDFQGKTMKSTVVFVSAILAPLALLTGCATTESVWVKSGSSQQTFNMDMGQCRAQAFSFPGAPLIQRAIVQSSCMEGKGWEREEQPIKR